MCEALPPTLEKNLHMTRDLRGGISFRVDEEGGVVFKLAIGFLQPKPPAFGSPGSYNAGGLGLAPTPLCPMQHRTTDGKAMYPKLNVLVFGPGVFPAVSTSVPRRRSGSGAPLHEKRQGCKALGTSLQST